MIAALARLLRYVWIRFWTWLMEPLPFPRDHWYARPLTEEDCEDSRPNALRIQRSDTMKERSEPGARH